MGKQVGANERGQLVRELHEALLEISSLMSRPTRYDDEIHNSKGRLDRVLFPLLLSIERYGPIGVVDVADRVGRDYTTVSRHITKLQKLGLINRQPGNVDRRLNEAVVTEAGKTLIKQAEERRIAVSTFDGWKLDDVRTLVYLLNRLSSALACPDVEGSGAGEPHHPD